MLDSRNLVAKARIERDGYLLCSSDIEPDTLTSGRSHDSLVHRATLDVPSLCIVLDRAISDPYKTSFTHGLIALFEPLEVAASSMDSGMIHSTLSESASESDQGSSQACCSSSSSDSSSSSLGEMTPSMGLGRAHTPQKQFVTNRTSSSRLRIVHPYTRLVSKKDDSKRRRIWNHALEKSLFNPYELQALGAPHRRTIYLASLEAHVDKLHAQLFEAGCCPVSAAELEPFRGLNSKTAKSTVSGLQHEVSVLKLKLLELERANQELGEYLLGKREGAAEFTMCRF
ncbi:hypothetical protein NP233_g5949 [Leucocoprinus birnbaumii]|uniref:Uncharacterized protein n=1 Tax=Leucocoprinus birnbaumii TaxID=56174 RepID=A0AAD5VS77_9AGAR|nr:hypothetical protein NP233_g5949 [Leucocoprinus birnbaumii]